jgi:hypothetical protein
LLASSSRMVVPLLTTTSRRSPPFTWCCISGNACRSSSRPSLARRPALGQTAASLTSFPLEEPSHDKSIPRSTSLCLARQVSASHDKSPPRATSLRLARQVSTSHDKSLPRTTSLRLRLVHKPRRTTRVTLPMREEEQISMSRGNKSWRPCRRPAPARALMQV